MEKKLGLYIHIPFCEHKCDYCDFYSLTKFDDYVRFVDAMLLQMDDYAAQTKDYIVDTVFIGGGRLRECLKSLTAYTETLTSRPTLK